MQVKIDKIFNYSAIGACVVLFFLAVLTFCDVVGRRFFNSPVMGTIEIVEVGMALVAFLAMPRAFFLNSSSLRIFFFCFKSFSSIIISEIIVKRFS